MISPASQYLARLMRPLKPNRYQVQSMRKPRAEGCRPIVSRLPEGPGSRQPCPAEPLQIMLPVSFVPPGQLGCDPGKGDVRLRAAKLTSVASAVLVAPLIPADTARTR